MISPSDNETRSWTKNELKRYVRFQLSQLSPENGQHDFEKLSYEIARRRVAPNLLPATGPVSAGGDQGRDFESYRTYVTGLLTNNVFLLTASEKVIAGACTLEKLATLSRKINDDTASICGSGTKPDLIVYFCEQDVPVAKRHAWIKRCSETHGVELQIFDGAAISDLLTDPDTFWIAEQYLSVPSYAFPAPVVNQRYTELKRRWLSEDATPENVADFIEIKSATRSARTDAPVDLEAWIRKLHTFIGNGFSPRLEQRARYEICIAELRGRGSLDPVLDVLHMFFESVTSASVADELSDAAVMMTYVWGAQHLGQTSLSAAQALDYYEALDTLITDAISSPSASSAKCALLEAHAMLSIVAAGDAATPDSAAEILVQRWQLVLDEVKQTPLFPVAHIGDIFQMLAKQFGNNDRVRKMANEVDAIVAAQDAAETVGERSLKRAIDHVHEERRIAALSELQRVKSAWLNGETLDGAILAMISIARIYLEMRLNYAARYYAAAALLVAVRENNDRAKRMIGKAADIIARSFYATGEGITYVHAVGHAMRLHGATVSDPGNWQKHDSITALAAMAFQFRVISRRIAPQVCCVLDSAFREWPMEGGEIEEMTANCETLSPFAFGSVINIEQQISDELGANPFSDLGPVTEISWLAFGVHWSIVHGASNDERIMALAVAATLQVLQADLADVELAIIPSEVVIRLSLADIAQPQNEQVPSNQKVIWDLKMPSNNVSDDGMNLAIVAILLLRQLSALPDEALDDLTEQKFKQGLAERVTSVRPATELMALAEPPTLDRASMRTLGRPTFSVPIIPQECAELAWATTKGPGYSRERAIEMLTNRYSYAAAAVAKTLPRLLADPRCCVVLRQMRASGMRDWMMLNAIASIVCVWQAEQVLGHPESSEELLAMRKWMHERIHRPENENDAEFDLEEFTAESVSQQAVVQPLSTLANWKLVYRQRTPDSASVRRFLDVRYGYSEDDIEHVDPFPGL